MHKLLDDDWPLAAPPAPRRRRPGLARWFLALALTAALLAALWPRSWWSVAEGWGVSWLHAVLAVAWLVAAVVARVSPRRLLRKLTAPLFALAIGAAFMLVVYGVDAGLPLAANALARGGISVAMISLLACVYAPEEIVVAAARLGAPRALVGGVAGLLRYAALLSGELARMRRDRAARRPAPASLLTRDGLRVEASLAGGLLVRSLLRTERVHAAMLARGYDGRIDPWLPYDEGSADAA